MCDCTGAAPLLKCDRYHLHFHFHFHLHLHFDLDLDLDLDLNLDLDLDLDLNLNLNPPSFLPSFLPAYLPTKDIPTIREVKSTKKRNFSCWSKIFKVLKSGSILLLQTFHRKGSSSIWQETNTLAKIISTSAISIGQIKLDKLRLAQAVELSATLLKTKWAVHNVSAHYSPEGSPQKRKTNNGLL